MFRQITRPLFSAFGYAKPRFNYFSRIFTPGKGYMATGLAAIPLYMCVRNDIMCAPYVEDEEKEKVVREVKTSAADPRLIENPRTLWEKIRLALSHVFRFFQLIFIFLPPLLTFPLKLFKITEKLWLKMFVSSVERAGVVWIKAFQYLSHRRDVIGPEMAESFDHLRENAPQHSF